MDSNQITKALEGLIKRMDQQFQTLRGEIAQQFAHQDDRFTRLEERVTRLEDGIQTTTLDGPQATPDTGAVDQSQVVGPDPPRDDLGAGQARGPGNGHDGAHHQPPPQIRDPVFPAQREGHGAISATSEIP